MVRDDDGSSHGRVARRRSIHRRRARLAATLAVPVKWLRSQRSHRRLQHRRHARQRPSCCGLLRRVGGCASRQGQCGGLWRRCAHRRHRCCRSRVFLRSGILFCKHDDGATLRTSKGMQAVRVFSFVPPVHGVRALRRQPKKGERAIDSSAGDGGAGAFRKRSRINGAYFARTPAPLGTETVTSSRNKTFPWLF